MWTATGTDEMLVETFPGSGVLSNDYPGGEGSFEAYGYYRYSINGQEKTDEISGAGNHTTAQFWEYDTRLGRRWNLDPKPNPSLSSYSAFANNPIWFTDFKGDTVEIIFGKPYTDANGEEHLYGHAALRVFNAKEGYNMVYDFGRYGKVDWNQTTGEGIMNVYSDASKYLASEMKDRSSVGFTQGTSVEQDIQVMSYFKVLTDAGSVYNGGAVPNGGGTAYKLASKYNIFDNNCLTQSCTGLGKIGINWIGGENDPRDGLKSMEGKFKTLNLTRTEYNKGGLVNVTFKMKSITFTPLKFDFKTPSLIAPADNTRVVKPLVMPLKKQ